MSKILLTLGNEKNFELIKKELMDRHEVIEANGKEDCEKSFDLVIFDIPTFQSLQDKCKNMVEQEKPLFLPVLLLVSEDKKDTAGQYLGNTVDEILICPVRKIELRTRVSSLLRTRRISLKLKDQMEKKALKDPLTGLYNKRYFNEIINKEAKRADRYGHPIAFCMMDMNNFKKVNDTYTHLIGDEVLREISQLLKENTRESDILIRYGGDEFLLIMPETNGEAMNAVERLNEKLSIWNKETDIIDFPINIAFGHSHWLPNGEKCVEEALEEADRNMYKNKNKIK